jgi:hypothetical protein
MDPFVLTKVEVAGAACIVIATATGTILDLNSVRPPANPAAADNEWQELCTHLCHMFQHAAPIYKTFSAEMNKRFLQDKPTDHRARHAYRKSIMIVKDDCYITVMLFSHLYSELCAIRIE